MKRAGLDVLLIEKGEIGGLLRNANLVENYLGYPDGISGKDLINQFEDHLKSKEVIPVQEEVIEIGRNDQSFVVKTDTDEHKSKNVIIATGTTPKKAGVEGEDELVGSKLFYEVADVPSDDHKNVVIVGGGDAAFDYAINLHLKGCIPIILMRGNPTCLPLLKERAEKYQIEYQENSPVDRISQGGEGIEIQSGSQNIKADYVLIAVGREPHYPPVTTDDHEGLYFVGDVHSGIYRQVHIATGDALQVAMKIIRSLRITKSC